MAKINEIISPDVLKSIEDLNAGFQKTNNTYSKLVKDIVDGKVELKNYKGSLDEVNKALAEASNILKEREKLQKQQQGLDQKLIGLKQAETKEIIKTQEAIKKEKQEIKESLVLSGKEAKTKEQLLVRNKQLRRELSQVTVAHFKTRKERKESEKQVKALTKEIDKNQKVINKNSDTLVQSKNNIGNYGSAFSGLLTPIRAAGAALKSFLANPVVAVMAGIAAIFTIVVKAMKRSEDGQDRLNKVMTVATSVWDNLLDVITIFGTVLFDTFPKMLQKVGNFFQRFTSGIVEGFTQAMIGINKFLGRVEKVEELKSKLAEINKEQEELKKTSQELSKEIGGGFQEAIQKAKDLKTEVGEDIIKAKELAAIEAAFNRDERKAIVENAQLAMKSSALRAQSEELKKIAAEDAIGLLTESFKLDEQVLENELKLAKTRVDIAQRTSALASDTIEDKKAIAEAEAAVFNIETRFNELRRQRTRRLNILRLEAFKQESERAKAALDIEKNNAAALIAINKEIIDNEFMGLEDRVNALNENAELKKGFAEKELGIALAALDKEKELKLKSDEDYLIEKDALYAKFNADQVKATEEAAGQTFDLTKKLRDAEADAAQQDRARAAEAQLNQARLTSKNEEELAQRTFDITKSFIQQEIAELQKLVNASAIGSEERIRISQELADKQQELDNLTTDSALENIDKRKESLSALVGFVGEVGGAVFEIKKNFLDKENEANETQKAYELELAGDNETKREAIEEKFLKKSNEIKLKQAKADRNQALFNIALNTAVGITKALPNLILAGIAAALGLIQAGVVLSKPIPKFAGGTKGQFSTPSMFLAGEAGVEALESPSGRIIPVKEPTVFTNAAGYKVYSNPELERMAGSRMGYDDQTLRDEVRNGFEMLNKNLSKQKLPIIKDGRVVGFKQDNYTRGYIDRMIG